MKNLKPLRRIIGLWAGASPAKTKEVKQGLNRLKALGLAPVFEVKNFSFAAKAESKERPFLAGADIVKARALVQLLRNPHVHDILCVRGGYGSLRLIPHLEKLRLPKTPTRLWGFSDMTSIQNYLFLRAGYPWVHSPMLTSIAFIKPKGRERPQWETLKAQKFRLKPLSPRKVQKIRLPKSALVLGGNLTCLASLASWDHSKFPTKNFVCFLEDVAEKPYRLDRMLTLLTQSGYFKKCRALLLGHFSDCKGWQGVFKAWSEENGIPVFYGIPAGHHYPNIALPMGVKISMHPQGQNFESLVVEFPKSLIGC